MTPGADPDTRLDGALLVSEMCRDLFLLRSVIVDVKGE